jgi:Fe-S cluster assembly ATP-binding protein
MVRSLLLIKDLQATVENKPVLKKIQLEIKTGELVVLMGANGSGKSSLAMTLMGDNNYLIKEGSSITLQGKEIASVSADERARLGLFVAWQNPISIPGVSLFNLCKASYEAQRGKLKELVSFKKKLEELAEKVGLPREVIGRGVNEGFSGGERKRFELLQLLLLEPKLAILDEIDSGLDIDGLKMVAKVIVEMKEKGTAFMLITHYKRLLDYVKIDKICVMKQGVIERVGGVELSEQIEEQGYGKLSTGV